MMTDLERHTNDIHAETCIDIAVMAGFLIGEDRILVEDSRELINFIQTTAAEFDKWFAARGDTDNAEYLEEVDDWAERKLLEHYGVKR